MRTRLPDIFDPDLYRGVRRPVAEAETLPAWCYTSPEFYAREVDRIFGRGTPPGEVASYLVHELAA